MITQQSTARKATNAVKTAAKVVTEKPRMWAIIIGDMFLNRVFNGTTVEAQNEARRVAKSNPGMRVSILGATESFTYH